MEGFVVFWLSFVNEVRKMFSSPGECDLLIALAKEIKLALLPKRRELMLVSWFVII